MNPPRVSALPRSSTFMNIQTSPRAISDLQSKLNDERANHEKLKREFRTEKADLTKQVAVLEQ
jgi:hypothetical protein